MNESEIPINILWVVDHLGFDERIHGAGMFYLNVIPALDENNFRISLCILRKKNSLHRYVVDRGIERVTYLERSKYDPLTLFGLKKVVAKESINIMHLHGYGSNNFGRLARIFQNIPTIIHQHDPATYYPIHQKVADLILLRYTDTTLAVSESVKHAAAERRGIPLDQIKVLPTCIPLSRFKLLSPEEISSQKEKLGLNGDLKIIGTITRLYEQKGNEYLIKAMPRVLKEFKGAVLVIVGDGPLRSELEKLGRDLGVSKNIIFTGHCHDVRRMLGIFDVKVLPSLWEGTPITMLEAMAMRRPIVATTIDGIGEVLTDNVTALMVPPRNSAELAEKSLLLLKDEETAQRLGASAHEHSREYDVSTCARRLEELYRNLHSLKMSDHTGPYTDCSAKSPTEVVGKKRMMKP